MNIVLKRAGGLLATAVALSLIYSVWQHLQPQPLPQGFAKSNGRLEAVEVDLASKTPGRLAQLLVDEGDYVNVGDTVAKMDTLVLDAQLKEATAHWQQAEINVTTVNSQVQQREAELKAATAVVAQRQAEQNAAEKQLSRTRELVRKGTSTAQQLDEHVARYEGAKAGVSAAQAQVAAAQAALSTTHTQVIAAQANVTASKASVERIEADLSDAILIAPRSGRVQYRVAQEGEIVAAGGAIINLVDLNDVYMTFYLPTQKAGQVAIGAEARVVLDAAPDHPIPAHITFVANVAQFTPKTVDTEEERQKLMFRIKARIDPEFLTQNRDQMKVGLPGMVYVKLDRKADWPDDLQLPLPSREQDRP